jgi:hypothetical protein
MNSEVMNQIKQIIETKAQAQLTPMEFELAYQARVAMDRIRFAIKHTEQSPPHTDQMQEMGLQLLDALQRLETAERRFQERSRMPAKPASGKSEPGFGTFCRDRIEPSSLKLRTNGCSASTTKEEARSGRSS